jgi:V-type H+-transporting ATPase subunit a
MQSDLELNQSEEQSSIKFGYLAGLIPKKSILRFKMMIHRKTRGNAITIIENIIDLDPELLATALNKSIYVIIFQESQTMREGIARICKAFENGVYDLNMDVKAQIERTAEESKECRKMLKIIKEEWHRKLLELAGPVEGSNTSLIEHYRWFFERECIIYTNINLLKADRTWYKGFCWCPLKKHDEVVEIIAELKQRKKLLCSNLKEILNCTLEPPTLFRSNAFLSPFSSIVETYGIASYQEINPAVFTIITFPFLFGVMFGDVAHGLVLFGLSIYLCLFRKLIKPSSILFPLTSVRYLLLLMGFFSTFSGIIYNEFASLPLFIGNSCYNKKLQSPAETIYTKEDSNCVYSLGIDPIWHIVDNKIQFLNSYKMKLSMMFGVLHMILGIVLKGLNAHFNKDSLTFYAQFLPQLIFMVILFGYMNLMIIIKWAKDWTGKEPPSLITQMVNIVINAGDPGDTPLFNSATSQNILQVFILCTL